MLKIIVGSLLGRFVGIGTVAGGFWLLFRGIFDSNIPLWVFGSILIFFGMWIMVNSRRSEKAC